MENPLHVDPYKQKHPDKGDKEDQAARWTQCMSEQYPSKQPIDLNACQSHHSACWTAFHPDYKSDQRLVSQTLALRVRVACACLP